MKPRENLEAIIGPPGAIAAQRRERRRRRQPLGRAIGSLSARLEPPLTAPEDEPLFILAAGWRSGSTLVQRLVSSSRAYLMWGEPYARSELVTRMADSLRPISAEWPAVDDIAQSRAALPQEDRWAANFHPPLGALLESHRNLFRTLFAAPANDAGTEGAWGFKEVRLSADHALYLRLLFPRAKFVFLVRDPHAAYASYKAWRSWYRGWPDQQVRTAAGYGRMWSELAGSYLRLHGEVGALLLRYEDLRPGAPALAGLERLLGAPVDESVLERRISGRELAPPCLTRFERLCLDATTAPTARRFGYRAAD